MSYGMALLVFGAVLLIPLSFTYFSKVHKSVRSLQTGCKRVIIARVTAKVDSPAFRKNDYSLKIDDEYLRKLFFLRYKFSQFAVGDFVRIEVSEHGRQVIRITNASEKVMERLNRVKSKEPCSEKLPYRSVLFSTESKESTSARKFFGFLIPSKENFASALILDFNIAVFILMLASGVSIYKPLVRDLVRWVGNITILTLYQGQYWRLLTNIFVHGGIAHLFINALGFIFISVFVEKRLGIKRFLALYLFTGICASLASVWWHKHTVSVGASGAIFGLYGYFLAMLIMVKKRERESHGGMILMILIFVGYNLLLGIKGNTDNAAHIAGFTSGFIIGIVVFGWAMVYKSRRRLAWPGGLQNF